MGAANSSFSEKGADGRHHGAGRRGGQSKPNFEARRAKWDTREKEYNTNVVCIRNTPLSNKDFMLYSPNILFPFQINSCVVPGTWPKIEY